MPVLARFSQNWPQCAAHQEQPDEQSREKEYLPKPAEIDVLKPLVTEPKVHIVIEHLAHAHHLAGHRTKNYHQQ